MAIENTDLVFAGLMGFRSVKLIEKANIIQNELSKRVLPTIPFLPLVNDNRVLDRSFGAAEDPSNWKVNDNVPESQQFFPLSFSLTENGQKWLFPYEPMLDVTSGNTIVKRNVAKQGDKLIGTIKERWSRKDFEITVTGVLIGSIMKGTAEDCFPREQFEKLFEFLKYNKEFYIYSHLLETVGVTKVVVEDYRFPFTKGENVQAYELKLTSDYSYNLLIKEDF